MKKLIFLWTLAAFACLLFLFGCSTPQGYDASNGSALWAGGTNAVAIARHYVAPLVDGTPYGPLAEGILALATAGLAIWQTHLHRKQTVLAKNVAALITPKPPAV